MSPENQAFRDRLERHIQEQQLADDVAYVMKQDLKKMTDMLYYGIKIQRPRTSPRLSLKDVLIQYASFLVRIDDLEFSSALLRMLNRQQNQVLRRFAPRRSERKDVWDHVIPTSYVVSEIMCMVKARAINNLERLLDMYAKAGQRGITKEEDARLNASGLRNAMPPGWNWRDVDADLFARYRIAKINLS